MQRFPDSFLLFYWESLSPRCITPLLVLCSIIHPPIHFPSHLHWIVCMHLLRLLSGCSGAIPAAGLWVRGPGSRPDCQTLIQTQTAMRSFSLLSHCLLHMNTDTHSSLGITLIFHRTSSPTPHHPHVQPCSTFLLPPGRPSGLLLCLFAETLSMEAAHTGNRRWCKVHDHRHGWLTTWKAGGIIKTMAGLYETFVGFLAGLLESREFQAPLCVGKRPWIRHWIATSSGAVVL